MSTGIVTLFGALSAVRLRTAKARNCVEWLLPGSRECPKVLCFGFLDQRVTFCVFFLFLLVHHQSLRLSQPNNFADRQHARRHRAASDMLLVTCKWRYCCRLWALHGLSGVPIGALLVVLKRWLLVASVRRTFLVG